MLMSFLHRIALLALFGLNADAGPKPLYYTYQFENDQAEPVTTNFFNSLPEGFVWDTGYSPVTTDSLQVEVSYSNSDRDARIDAMLLPPGKSTLTLCTIPTSKTGVIDNAALVTPLVPRHDLLNANAKIELYPDFFDVPLKGNVFLVGTESFMDESSKVEVRLENRN
jgi:hypothetical protein